MARFDPKKHNLTRAEAKFLVDLSRLSTKDMAKEIAQAEKDVITCKAGIAKAKTVMEARLKAAQAQLRAATKQHKSVVKRIELAQKMIGEIKNAEADAANKKAVQLNKLCETIGPMHAAFGMSINSAVAECQSAHRSLVMFDKSTGSAGLQLVPSQSKIILAAP